MANLKAPRRPTHIFNAQDLGKAFRAERTARGLTQSEVARRALCQRQTIAAIEAGKNIELSTLLRALASIGKRIELRDQGVEFDQLHEIFGDDDED